MTSAEDNGALKKAVNKSGATWTIIDCPPSLLEAAPAIPLADLVIAPVPPRFKTSPDSPNCVGL
jgi:cellulose biosynthesis protein BcsQ